MLPIVRDVTLPTILAGHANGELPDDVLVDVGGGQLLVRDAAWSWIDMRNAAARDGVLLVIDHVAAPGAGWSVAPKLHRIEPREILADMQAAGFQFEAGSDVLRNAADDHSLSVFDPAIRGHTDQVVYRFRKPR